MTRIFNTKQRMALANAAEWKCVMCNTPLDTSFHADHIIPFSKGGITDVSNGQALCPTCNMQKGNRMSKKITWDNLRPFQQQMYTQFTEEIFPKKNIGLVNVSPGGGKTVASLYIANHMLRTGQIDKIIVVVPTTALVSQWHKEAADKFDVQLIENFSYDNKAFKEDDGFAMTYAGVVKKDEDIRLICSKYRVFAILDEAHHLSNDEEKAWGSAINKAFSNATYTMMLTGTPWRHGKDDILHLERKDGMAISDFKITKRQLLGESLRWTEFDKTIAKDIEFTNMDTGEDTYYKSREVAEKEKARDIYGDIVRFTKQTIRMYKKADAKLNAIRRTIPDAAGLIVAPDIKTAKLIAAELSRYGDYPVVHSSQDGDSFNGSEKIAAFKNDRNTKWIIAVDMIAEGIDIPRLQVCVFMSAKRTASWLWQVIARMERRRKEYIHTPINDSAYFYYIDDEEINKVVEDIENEQKKVEKKSRTQVEGSGIGIKNTRVEFLTGLRNVDGDIVYNNVVYKQEDPVTIFAINSFVNDPATSAYDFATLYNFARAAINGANSAENIMQEEETPTLSNEEIREELKEKIDGKIRHEMGVFMNANSIPKHRYGDIVSKIRRNLNASSGIKRIKDADISSLEKQIEILFSRDISVLA